MRLRGAALLLALGMLAASCSTARQVSDQAQEAISNAASEVQTALTSPDGDGSAGGEGTAPSTEGGGAGGQAGEGGQTQGGENGTGGDGTTQGGNGAASAVAVDDLGGVGANGHALLQAGVPKLVVEIDRQQGVNVDQAAVDHLVSIIRQVADKPGGVSVAGGNTFASDRTNWTADDLRAAAEANRNNHSDQQQVVLYLLYVRGGFYSGGQETNALGVTYNASEVGIFPDKWAGLGSLLGGGGRVERAVITHEFGHTLGLVNLTYQSSIDHEDADHPGHSSNKQSVMYWAIETTLIGQVFSGPPPDTFDQADQADIAGLRSGKY